MLFLCGLCSWFTFLVVWVGLCGCLGDCWWTSCLVLGVFGDGVAAYGGCGFLVCDFVFL